jgi:Putative zinc-finger
MQTREQTTAGNPGDMNHPRAEEWMAHLYGEVSQEERSRLSAHLKTCAECRGKFSQWRATVGSLDEWKLPALRPARTAPRVLKWGVAAALVLGVGLGWGGGRLFSANAKTVAELRREMRAEFQGQLDRQREQLIVDVARVVDERSLTNNRATLAALREMEAAHWAAYDTLTGKLETMAVLTESSLRAEQQQIVTLATYTEPNSTTQVH